MFHVENVEGEALEQVLSAHCPNILYPYARNVVSQLSTFGTISDVGLQPMDFLNLYQNRQKVEEVEKKQ